MQQDLSVTAVQLCSGASFYECCCVFVVCWHVCMCVPVCEVLVGECFCVRDTLLRMFYVNYTSRRSVEVF